MSGKKGVECGLDEKTDVINTAPNGKRHLHLRPDDVRDP